ncbi:hypothetical protein CDIK_0961 [Cucumispora dikerogammari]|nr:hypothetical protein CDIK_0961 [Cucumispora dikerogammari]
MKVKKINKKNIQKTNKLNSRKNVGNQKQNGASGVKRKKIINETDNKSIIGRQKVNINDKMINKADRHIKRKKKTEDLHALHNIPHSENQIINASRGCTAHLLDSIKENHKEYDIILENDYFLEIFKSKLAYIRFAEKLNLVSKKEYMKRRYKSDNVVFMHINDPLKFMERIEMVETKKSAFRLNKTNTPKNGSNIKTKSCFEDKNEHTEDEDNIEARKQRKYIIYTKQINTELLNAEMRIKYLNKSINYNEECRFLNIEIMAKYSFYDCLEKNILTNINNNSTNNKIVSFLSPAIKLSTESIKSAALHEENVNNECLQNDILDKRIPVYILNPSLNMYFPLLIEILNKLKTYNKVRILIITSNPNKLVTLLKANDIMCKQYQTRCYESDTHNPKLKNSTNKTENLILVSNVRNTFEKFDFVIEFILNDFRKMTESLNKKIDSKKFFSTNNNQNQKDFSVDLKQIGNLKIMNFNEMIFEKGVIVFPVFTEINKLFPNVIVNNKVKTGEEVFDIKNFIKK